MRTKTRICTLDEIQDTEKAGAWAVRLLFLHKPAWQEHDGGNNWEVTRTHPASYLVTFEQVAASGSAPSSAVEPDGTPTEGDAR
jgi:hypothetical protein